MELVLVPAVALTANSRTPASRMPAPDQGELAPERTLVLTPSLLTAKEPPDSVMLFWSASGKLLAGAGTPLDMGSRVTLPWMVMGLLMALVAVPSPAPMILPPLKIILRVMLAGL